MRDLFRRVLLGVYAAALTAVLAFIMFALAGRRDLPFLWAYVGIAGAIMVTSVVLIDPGLLKERIRPGPGGKDRWVIYVLKLLGLAHLGIAALDVGRLHLSDTVPLWLRGLGLAAFAGGLGFAVWAMIVNRFFSTVVRLQEERGHRLVSDGPYRFVRHPGYTGIAVALLGSPLALGSWLSAAPAVLFALLILRRTVIEDRFLRERLEGYPGYAQRVRFRLVPRVW